MDHRTVTTIISLLLDGAGGLLLLKFGPVMAKALFGPTETPLMVYTASEEEADEILRDREHREGIARWGVAVGLFLIAMGVGLHVLTLWM